MTIRWRHEPRSPVHSLACRRPRAAQSDRHRADVPVLGRRGMRDRLARHPPRSSGAVGRGAAHDRSDRGRCRRDASRRATSGSGPTTPKRALGAHARERPALVGHADRDPARARGTQGVDEACRGKGGGAGSARCSPAAGRRCAPSPVPFAGRPSIRRLRSIAPASRGIRDAFAAAARRAARLGLDAVQLHGAHGYLLHEFLSPLSNRRDDEYGGSLENRMRFPLEVFDAVREAVPAGAAGDDARLRHRLGAGRLGHRADDRVRAGARGARLRRRSTSRAAASRRRRRSRSARAIRCRWPGRSSRRRRCRSSPSA